MATADPKSASRAALAYADFKAYLLTADGGLSLRGSWSYLPRMTALAELMLSKRS